ncbi:MAG: hypothetical protein R3E77_11855 [Steroidobacteraceae bacterium]
MSDAGLPILLIVLDGLGDRPCPQLDGQTPCEAANTPVLDALAAAGTSGIHLPFGLGRATSSEHAHWAMFGYSTVPFPGRAALEAYGVGHQPPHDVAIFHLALRAGEARGNQLFLGARARAQEDREYAAGLMQALAGRQVGEHVFELLPLRTGEAILVVRGALSCDISDSDALFDHLHPWMEPLPLSESARPEHAARLAVTMRRWLQDSRRILLGHPDNAVRRAMGLPALEVAVTKWASWIDPRLPGFSRHTGLRGAAVTDTALYRGLARILGLSLIDIPYDETDPTGDMTRRLEAAAHLLRDADFVHLHVKATDEAAHTKCPELKRDVIAAIDRGLEPLGKLATRAVVAITGDHASPSIGDLLHSGDPTPFLVIAPTVRPDDVQRFGERFAQHGNYGHLRAEDLLPLLVGLANKPFFKGHRPGPWLSHALPSSPAAMPIDEC